MPNWAAPAPSARAAARPEPSANPPEAMTGVFGAACTMARVMTSVETRSGGGWPPASAPTATRPSTPAPTALAACSTLATTCRQIVPVPSNLGR
ncbi:hypothetical protein LUX73_02755 [Actinomadura madurae]|nr:hypothetical protein [Actinomadura madurae]MCQ0003788.1 hypothetical protein [Actinomadura madurae]